ncbi:DUF411 domain-containing protein [Halorubrum sp. DTA98]|uniref:DUF411 domain-containing protein n=1 Tax=Halorubrum sp. DTA98 TaxID=3402163 RepID=UPI003AAA8048
MTLEPLSRRSMIAAVGSTVALAGCLTGDANRDEWAVTESLSVSHAVQYNGPNCDCCDEYAAYLDDHLDGTLAVEELDDLDAVKREREVPTALDSCHTIALDDYVVEGHVPVEILIELFEEEPDVAGIALPGMPAGSPGMPGEKDGEWTVYAFDGAEEYEPFVER